MSLVTLKFYFDDPEPENPANPLTLLEIVAEEDHIPKQIIPAHVLVSDQRIVIRKAVAGEPDGDGGFYEFDGMRCYSFQGIRICYP